MRVGFIGLGNIGGPMALRVVKGGYQTAVFDIKRETAEPHLKAGAAWAESAAALAAQSDVILVSVPGPAEIDEVVFARQGILQTISSGAVYVELSTTLPSNMRRIHDALKSKGAGAIDAPVSGGAGRAATGELAVWIGGDGQTYERVKPILSTFGNKLTYMGGVGMGLTAKLVHNQMLYSTLQVISESFAMGVKAGLTPEILLKVARDGAYSNLLNMLPRAVTGGEFKWADFGMGHITRKDQMVANQYGRELDVPQPLANLVEQKMIETIHFAKK
ncbi:MAG TPA: NAD(P)-dependent oxidoreductase [Candidatus Binataceae bacterium]|nr:NAD(P)-dependent oxidoreductase [Candidatus Binataceae bacterium]